MATLGEFLGREAGQKRRKWLDETVGNTLSYFLGPTGIDDRLNAVAMLNPVNDVGEAMQNSRVMMDGSRSGRERFDAGVDMATNMAAVLAPVVAGKMAGGADEAADVVDALLGFGGPTREAATDYAKRFAADESGAIKLPLGGAAPKKEVLGADYGQMDLRLTIPGVEGRIDYSVFEGKPKINMIEVPESARRQGNATTLLRALQSEFPDTEIDWGSLTESGSRLYDATNFKEIPSQASGQFARLDSLRQRFAQKQQEFAVIEAKGERPPAGFFDEWNDLRDDIDDLEGALMGEARTNRLIDIPASDPATQRGQEVLDLLRNGRAGEVTDEMLDLGDPTLNARLSEYLFNNYDLPMDEASRMARAREMGFDTDAYHATGGDFSYFVPSEFRGASFFGPTPDGAMRGASASANEGVGSGTGSIIPARLNTSGVEGIGSYANRDMNEFRASLEDRLYSEAEMDALMASDAAPLRGDWTYFFDDLTDYDALRVFRDANPDAEIPEGIIKFKPKGKLKYGANLERDITGRQFAHYSDGMREAPISDRVKSQGNTGFSMQDESGLALGITDPTAIRSRFARFDPRLSHLRNLSAGAAGLGILGGANMQNDDNQPLRAYLGL